MLDDAALRAKRAPKHIISDQGVQFREEYRAWCARCGVRPRFGAVGQSGSIAVIERFMRSLKDEALRRILVPYEIGAMLAEVRAYATWYNEARPHQALRGATPNERFTGAAPAHERRRIEPRKHYPLPRGDPNVRRATSKLELVVRRHDDREHLPIIELREAA